MARRGFRQLAADRRGVAAVEFAVIVPVMLLLYIGIVDVSRGVIASRKLNYLARTISDLVSQQPTTQAVSIASLSNILTASSAILAPFGLGGLTMTVSAIDIRAKSGSTPTCCDAVVRWSYTQGGTKRPCSTPLTQVGNGTTPSASSIPSAIITANQNAGFNYTGGQTSYVIVADVTYSYSPIFKQAIAWFAPGMAKTSFMVPRAFSGPVTIADPSAAPTGQSGTICFQ